MIPSVVVADAPARHAMDQGGSDDVNVRFENRNGYLYAFFSGRRGNFSVALRLWRLAIEECHVRGFLALLVEQDFADALTRSETYVLADAVSKMPVSTLKLALVDRDVKELPLDKFAETVAINRGVNGRLFSCVDEAELWLCSG